MTPFLELRGVAVRLGRFRLEIDAVLSDGWSALFGPSGAGKTTLLEVITGLRRPDAGRIIMNGHMLFDAASKKNVPPRRRGIGYVPQDLALFPHLTVRQNLNYGRPPGDGDEFFTGVLERLEIGSLLAQKPDALSGGEKQRVALARRDEFRVPTLYVTHSADEAVALCGRVVVLEAGRMMSEGAVHDLFVPRDSPGWRLRVLS